LEESQRQLVREMEGRVRAEETARETSQQMATHRGSFLEKEVRRLTRAKRELEGEVRRLEETMASSMVDRSVLDTAVSRADEEVGRSLSHTLTSILSLSQAHTLSSILSLSLSLSQAHLKLSQKLQEVNTHLQQQVKTNYYNRTPNSSCSYMSKEQLTWEGEKGR
jgi:hypothetical protein